MRNKRNNNSGGGQRRHHGGGRRYNNNSGGGNNRGGGNDHQNIARQKHHATQMREKYMNHARDAQINGDRVDVEYYLQHVDHYNRVLTDIAVIEAERHERFREQQQQNMANQGEQTTGEGDAAPTDAHSGGGSDTGGEEPISQSNQPRMTRHPRRHHQQQGQQQHDNGAAAANANSEEIPLPGSALTAI